MYKYDGHLKQPMANTEFLIKYLKIVTAFMDI